MCISSVECDAANMISTNKELLMPPWSPPRGRPTLPIKFHAGWVSDLIEILCLILKHFIGPPLNMLGLRHLDIFIFQYKI